MQISIKYIQIYANIYQTYTDICKYTSNIYKCQIKVPDQLKPGLVSGVGHSISAWNRLSLE